MVDFAKQVKELGKNIIEIKYFAEKRGTSRTSVYRALAEGKLNEVVLGKASRFVILDDLAKKWKPGRPGAPRKN